MMPDETRSREHRAKDNEQRAESMGHRAEGIKIGSRAKVRDSLNVGV
jgi:hypothetical protein